MSIIEGIGDEVLFMIGVTVILLILLLAWYSTSVNDHPIFRASVLVIERRRATTNNNQSISSERRVIVTTADGSATVSASNEQQTATSEEQKTSVVTKTEETKSSSDKSASSSATLDESHEEERTRSEAQVEETEVEAPVTDNNSNQVEVDSVSDGNIRIRLVFLNDTQRLVEAKLDDRLGQFKQQHFSEELANHRTVRLIYNGQLLQRDQETLQFYGLFDNCVVHCHISSVVVTPQPQHYSTNSSDLDLSRLMLPLFGLVLGLIWCCRIEYRQYFNAPSTFALVAITGLFVVSVFSVCVTARNRMQTRS